METKATTKRRYSEEDKDRALTALSSLPETPVKSQSMTARDIVSSMRGEIKKRLDAGYTVEDILQALRDADVDISLATLKAYLKPSQSKSVKRGGKAATATADKAKAKDTTKPSEPVKSNQTTTQQKPVSTAPVYSNDPDDK